MQSLRSFRTLPNLFLIAPFVLAIANAKIFLNILKWPVFHDSALMHFMGREVLYGSAPYRDFLDMNLPLSYMISAANILFFGYSDLSFVLFELTWLAVTLILVFLITNRINRFVPWFCCLIFAITYLSGGPYNFGQRDFHAFLFILICLQFGCSYIKNLKTINLFNVAFFAGLACAIKPTLACAGLGIIAYCVAHTITLDRRRIYIAILGFVLPLSLSAIWLLYVGGLSSFYNFYSAYVIPIYSTLGKSTTPSIIQKSLSMVSIFIPFMIVAPILKNQHDHQFRLLGIVCVGTLASALIQAKGWDYQIIPFQLSFCLFASIYFSEAIHNPSNSTFSSYRNNLLVIAIVIIFSPFLLTSSKRLQPPNITHVQHFSDVLKQKVQHGQSIQVFDTTYGAVNALYRADLRQASRFIYDFYFYSAPNSKFVRKIRDEIFTSIESKKTKWLVFTPQSWPDERVGINRLKYFPELNSLVQKFYQVVYQSGGFVLYERKQD